MNSSAVVITVLSVALVIAVTIAIVQWQRNSGRQGSENPGSLHIWFLRDRTHYEPSKLAEPNGGAPAPGNSRPKPLEMANATQGTGEVYPLRPPLPKLFIQAAEDRHEVDVEVAPMTIGRHDSNKLVLLEDHVSRFHAKLSCAHGGRGPEGTIVPLQWYIEDSGSSNGLFVNGRRIGQTIVESGDAFQIGPYTIFFYDPLRPEARRTISPEQAELLMRAGFTALDAVRSGGMAEIYIAQQHSDGRTVAVKLPRIEDVENPDTVIARFRQEAETGMALKHPDIVPVLQLGTLADGKPFMAMEYMPNGTLRNRLRQNHFVGHNNIRTLAATLADALTYAHSRGTVHRDVKPENVLFDDQNCPKLADFGIAHAMSQSRLTHTGSLLGTPHYMAPEQIDPSQWGKVTPATDSYALGCVLYELATGRCPFEGSPPTVMHAHLHDTPRPASEINRTLPDDLNDTIMNLLNKEPSRRPTMSQVLATTSPGDSRIHGTPPGEPVQAPYPGQYAPTAAAGRN